MRAVRFDSYGDVDVLYVAEVADPVPVEGEVVVAVRAAGINPGEAAVRRGALHDRWPATFPSGQGSDLAGVVEAVGANVAAVAVGDEVIGFSNKRNSQAELVAVAADQVTPRPDGVPWDAAGALFVAGATAWAAVRAVAPAAGETVVISGAAGGVGSIALQLAAAAGARVIGLASEQHHDWLRQHGAIAVTYGDGAAERIRAAADGQPIAALVDTYGSEYVDLGIELGVAPQRIDTIIDYEAAQRHGTRTDASAQGSSAAVLAELASMIAAETLEIPIAQTYPLEEVREAYRELERRHTLGKIVLHP
jgi:NADPH:quinone reductase-like Zn-dependent oxidoreductase